MSLTIKGGDATDIRREKGDPKTDIILHGCNDIGAWGAGFVMALSRRWPEPERNYRFWARKLTEWAQQEQRYPYMALGAIQPVTVEEGVIVVNMITQHLVGQDELGNPPFRPEAFRAGLIRVRDDWEPDTCRIHMPWIGCGLAGGKRAVTRKIVEEELGAHNYDVTIYDYDPPAS